MPSPFPGMDPYLEGYLWGDVHGRLAGRISIQLAPLIEPRYVARMTTRIVTGYDDDGDPNSIFPDTEVIEARRPLPTIDWEARLLATPSISPPTLELPAPLLVNVPITSVEIRDTKGNILVTSIEILSPVNKREPGIREYRRKRDRVLGADAHLLEIDLLRRGERPISGLELPNAPYFIFLTRTRSPRVSVWSLQFQDPLPVIPLPLKHPDPDVPLDLATAFQTIYDEARYHLSLDYREDPTPPLRGNDAAWADTLLREKGMR